jgi:hypothetical protein
LARLGAGALLQVGADPGWGQRRLNNEDLEVELKINGDLRLNNSDLRQKSCSQEGYSPLGSALAYRRSYILMLWLHVLKQTFLHAR